MEIRLDADSDGMPLATFTFAHLSFTRVHSHGNGRENFQNSKMSG